MYAVRDVFWAPLDGLGFEHLRLVEDGEGITADGLIIGLKGDSPYRAQYKIRCDSGWRVRRVDVAILGGDEGRMVGLRADGLGRWQTGRGEPLPEFEGCFEVDLSATPFTNSLPINRLKLRPRESRDLMVVYIPIPEMGAKRVNQRYSCLKKDVDGGLYLYEGLFRGFEAELPVDADGLVLDYPETFRRVWPR